MKYYHVFSLLMMSANGKLHIYGVALKVEVHPWVTRRLAHVAYKNGKYYMYFPLKYQNDIFRIGAVSDKVTKVRLFQKLTR